MGAHAEKLGANRQPKVSNQWRYVDVIQSGWVDISRKDFTSIVYECQMSSHGMLVYPTPVLVLGNANAYLQYSWQDSTCSQ